MSILITLGRRRGGWDGDGDGAVERVEWKHSREGGGENRTHKGRLKKAERERERANTRTNRSPKTSDILLMELFSCTEIQWVT